MRRLRDNRDGAVAMMFGLLLLPTLVAIGVGVDVARAYSAKIRFDAAFNNAAMALQSSPAGEPAAALQARIQSYLDLANPSHAPGGRITLSMSDPLKPIVVVTASGAVPTTLMQLAGVRSLPLHAAAQVVRQHPPGPPATSGSGEDRGGGADDSDQNGRLMRHDVGGIPRVKQD